MHENKLGGIQYDEPPDQRRAKLADLITIAVPGTNCGNCLFFNQSSKLCRHPAVKLQVNDKMCCKFWRNSNQINSWED